MNKRFTLFLVLFLFLMGSGFADVLDPKVKEAMENNRDGEIRVIVQLKEQFDVESLIEINVIRGDNEEVKKQVTEMLQTKSFDSQYWIRNYIETTQRNAGIQDVNYFWIINAVSMQTSAAVIRELADSPEVGHIFLDEYLQRIDPVQATETRDAWGVPYVKAPDVWALGYQGLNVTVAIVDTGVNMNHPELAGRVKKGMAKSFVPAEPSAEDLNGHGSHCAGIVAATNYGVAPKAYILPVKVLNASGSGYSSWIVAGIQYAYPNAKLISMSLGGSGTDTPMENAVRQAIAGKVQCCIAAGNSGPSSGTISTPGLVKEALTVGSIGTTGVISYFSSRGPTVNGDAKPDIVGPGENITSLYKDGGYATMSGTSMATPHVAGVAALMLSRNPNLCPRMVKNIIMQNASGTSQINVYGKGTVDALKAINATPMPSEE